MKKLTTNRAAKSLATKSLAATIIACALAAPIFANEVGYDATLGEMHAQITYSYNNTWDETYGAFWSQPSQLVLSGPEALDLINPEPFTGEEWEYLSAVLESDGSKAILLEDPLEEIVKIFVPKPTHSEPAIAIPSQWQYRSGVWARGGVLQENCSWYFFSRGQQGTGTGCNCMTTYEYCCDAGCDWPSFCGGCYSSDREWLESMFGADPRWENPRPFQTLEPGQRLETEAAMPY